MITEMQPEWFDDSHKKSLKVVLKWEIQMLLQRLSDIGEETILFTADLEDGNAGQMGSERGCNFLLLSDIQEMKSKFLSFCADCRDTSHTGSYRDLSTGKLTPCPSVTKDSKRRAHTSNSRHKKRVKRSHTDIEVYDQQSRTRSDDMETQNDDAQTTEQTDVPSQGSLGRSVTRKSKSGSSSRRKRTPVKLKSNYNSDSNIEVKLTKIRYYSDDNEISEYQSDETGCREFRNFNVKSTHSSSMASDNQSSGSENSGDQSTDKLTKTGPITITERTTQKIAQKCGDSGDTVCLDVQTKENDKQQNLVNLLQATNCRTLLLDDGGMKIIQNVEVKKEMEELCSEDIDGSASFNPRPGSKHFKSASSDEVPEETALLDSSKLCVGRYQCPYCFLIVRDRHDLKRHIRTHTKEKPYHCELCGKNFSRKWDLENHMRRHQEEAMKETLSKGPVMMVDLDAMQEQSKIQKLSASEEDNQREVEEPIESETVDKLTNDLSVVVKQEYLEEDSS